MKSSSMSRRRFLQSTGAAAMIVPTAVRGYTAAEMQSFYVNGEMQQNVSKWELDTPSSMCRSRCAGAQPCKPCKAL